MADKTRWPRLGRGDSSLRDLIASLPSVMGGDETSPPADAAPTADPLTVDELAEQLAIVMKRPK